MERKGIETERGRGIREAEASTARQPEAQADREFDIGRHLDEVQQEKDATAEMNCELAAAVKEARAAYERNQQIEWWQCIEDAIERGAGSRATRDRRSEGERPEGWQAQMESAATLEHMRGLRTELAAMGQDIRQELQDETLGHEYRAALREVAGNLRELHYDTNREIAALALEQAGYKPVAMEMGRQRLDDFARTMESISGRTADLVGTAV